MFDAARAFAADSRDVPPRGMRQRELAVEIAHFAGHAEAVHLPEQNGRGGFDDAHRRIAQDVGKAHARNVVPQAQRVRQIRIGIQLHVEVRRASLASEARKDALKNAVAPRERRGPAAWLAGSAGCSHEGLRRTGGGAISCAAFSISFIASCVASIASSRLSLYVSRSGPLAARSWRYGRNSFSRA